MKAPLDALLWRLGVHPVPANRGVLLVVGSADDAGADDWARFLERLHARQPRLNLFVLSLAGRPQALRRKLPERLPVILLPPPLPGLASRWLQVLKLQACVTEAGTVLPGAFAELLRRSELPVFTGYAAGDGAARLLEELAPHLASRQTRSKRHRPLESRLLDAMNHAPLRWITRDRFTMLESLDDLAAALDHPRVIACLGNGPSSEDPELAAITADAVFRVNHSWVGRPAPQAALARPQMIFTGKRDTLKAYGQPTIYGLQSGTAARRIMLRAVGIPRPPAADGRRRQRIPLFVAGDRLENFGPYLPTNGAVALATAVALAPERLVVAGMDLFSDPRGSYPGDTTTPNAYTVAHDRDAEAEFILRTLAACPGEVVIVGEVLRQRWNAYRDRQANGPPTSATQPQADPRTH